MPSPTRVFLGSGPDLLARAADQLLDAIEDPIDLGDTLVCVPGARAGRLLLRLLGERVRARGMAGFLPPRVMTVGRLVDDLVQLERPTADRLVRTVAWERALRALPRAEFPRIHARRPAPDDRGAWWRLADDVRAAHAEIAVAGLDFAEVADRLVSGAALAPASEERRFRALADVQGTWRELLDDLGQDDPHEARRAAVDAGAVRADARVVLVGVVDLNPLARAVLEALEHPPTALVFADEELASAFDELGGLRADERWTERPVALSLDQWRVVDGPDDQARMAVAAAGASAEAGSLERADDLVVGVPDREVVPFLVRRFAARGITARDAAGTPLERTAPARLLTGLAAFLESRSFERFAALVRHADLEELLARTGEPHALERLDTYRRMHLPRHAARPIASDLAVAASRKANIEELARLVDGLLGSLSSGESRPVGEVAADLSRFLGEVYAPRADAPAPEDLDPVETEARRVLRVSLDALGDAIDAVAALPPAIAGKATARGVLELVLRAAQSGGAVPPPPAAAAAPTVELLGWLDLALDPASHVVVTGFTEGSVPARASADGFITAPLREALGLPGDDERFAHDVYTLTLLLESSRSLTVVCGRRARAGDPLFPSRLAFARPTEEAVERIDHALAPEGFRPAPGRTEDEATDPPSILVPDVQTDEFAVTSFSVYMDSPALFHIRRHLRLEAVDDGRDELDALVFGTLAHDVLERFGKSKYTASSDVDAIRGYLDAELDRVVARYFAGSTLAAVRLQIEQMRLRLHSFAVAQGAEVDKGWRIEHVEWEPSTESPHSGRNAVELSMPDGEPSAWIIGKVDRIDRNVDGRLRVVDYKTSAKAAKAYSKHVKRGKKGEDLTPDRWRDLQLPLYAHLVQELGEGIPTFAYFNLPGDGTAAAVDEVTWDLKDLTSAMTRARQIVAEVRSGERLAEVGKVRLAEPIEEELLGVGLVVAPSAEADAETEGA